MRVFLRRALLALACLAIVAVALAGMAYAHAQSLTVAATNAQVVSETYRLGTPFAGTVQDIAVQRGDPVSAGQELFRLQSPTLESAMQKEGFSDAAVGYRVEPGGLMVFTASRAGIAQQVTAKVGSFVRAGSVVVEVAIAETVHLRATFVLNDRSYARMPRNGRVVVAMPDGSDVVARIYDVEVAAYEGGRATTIVRARSAGIEMTDYSVVGAPVAARLQLTDDGGPASWLATTIGRLFTPGGFQR